MTWRAFVLGLLFVAGMALLEPYVGHAKGWGGFSSTSFPGGAVLVLVVLTLGLNVVIKLIRRAWSLRQAELMLVWCMLIVGATFPGDGIGRFWYSFIAAGPYMSRRADVAWEEENGALVQAPEGLVLSKDPKSVAARLYYEGGEGRVPWRVWATPLLSWGAFFVMLYLAVFFLMGMLRRQWVESERLMFPLARVPLEFTEERAGGGLLPRLFAEKGFLLGLIFAFTFRLLRDLPLFFGAEAALPLTLPMGDVFLGTPFQPMDFSNFEFWPSAVGFAFLVPADVSLSIWFFYLFARTELQVASYLGFGSIGGTYGALMSWQQAGAYIAFTVSMLFMARRQLLSVLRKAVGRSGVDDSGEPISYPVAFWGMTAALVGCLAWYIHYGAGLLEAVLIFAMIMCWYVVYARMVAQAGLYVGRTIWHLGEFVNSATGGRVMGGPGAVISNMQDTILVTGGSTFLAPMAINAFRISEVFEKRKRRLLLPILMLTLLVAMACASYTSLTIAYSTGVANWADPWTHSTEPKWRLDAAHLIIKQPTRSAEPHFGPLLAGAVGMGFLTFMRARFYWWPIHPVGLLSCSSWHAHRLWLPFLVGWLVKVGIMKLSGGHLLRSARYFFIGLIMVEGFVGGVSTVVRAITKGAVPGF